MPASLHALRRSTSSGVRAGRVLADGLRTATAEVAAAAAERRGILRTLCMAVEKAARATRTAVEAAAVDAAAAWRAVPLAGRLPRAAIATTTWLAMRVLSGVIAASIACDIFLNTARSEQLERKSRRGDDGGVS